MAVNILQKVHVSLNNAEGELVEYLFEPGRLDKVEERLKPLVEHLLRLHLAEEVTDPSTPKSKPEAPAAVPNNEQEQ